MRKSIIKAGDKYNKLTAIKFSHRDKNSTKFWIFKCDCGNEKIIQVKDVKCGHTKSCGCWNKESLLKRITKHKMCGTKTYYSWVAMKTRCLNKNTKKYKDYGGRGIEICDEWLNFENFYKDMGNRPEGKFIERINNDRGYYKENCRWATMEEQTNNTRRNRLITYKGKTLTLPQWAKKIGIKKNTLKMRIYRGWSIEKIFIT